MSPCRPDGYVRWEYAGGPDECRHGYAAGIPCPDCDDAHRDAKPVNADGPARTAGAECDDERWTDGAGYSQEFLPGRWS